MEREEEYKGSICKKKELETETAGKIRKNSAIPTEREEAIGKIGTRSRRGRPSKVEELQRSRTRSEGSILDFYNRKGERTEEEREEGVEGTARKRGNSVAAQTEKDRDKEGKSQKSSMNFKKTRKYDRFETNDNNDSKEHEYKRRYKKGNETTKTEYRNRKK